VIGLENSEVAPFAVLAQAKATVARIYAQIGVKVMWCSGGRANIPVQFDIGIPSTVHPGALAYAMPYAKSGTRIHVFFDRLPDPGSQRLAGALLGHVMAHELGHVLEGLSRHADLGVMKAQWDYLDFDQMRVRPLSFSTGDIDLIRLGVARHAAHSQSCVSVIGE